MTGSVVGVPELLVACLAEPRPVVPVGMRDRPLDLNGLDPALDFHRVGAAVARQLRDMDNVPQHIRSRASKVPMMQALTHLRVAADLTYLGNVLDAASIPWLVMKGPAVAETLYPDRLMREFADLDVLVPRRLMRRTVTALVDSGAPLVDRNWPLIYERMSGELSLLLPNGTPLDLHWALINGQEKRALTHGEMDDVFTHSRSITSGPQHFPAMRAEDQLIHLAILAFVSGGQRLGWMKDLQLAILDRPDWSVVVQQCEAWGAGPIVGVMLGRAGSTLGVAVQTDLIRELTPAWRRVVAMAARRWPPERSHEHLNGLSGTEFLWSTRGSTLKSIGVFGRSVTRRAFVRTVPADSQQNPLHQDVPDAEAMDLYWSQLSSTATP